MQEQLVYQPCLIDVLVLEACHYCVPDVNATATYVFPSSLYCKTAVESVTINSKSRLSLYFLSPPFGYIPAFLNTGGSRYSKYGTVTASTSLPPPPDCVK